VGIRARLLTGDVDVRAESDCPSPPCEFTKGPARVTIAVADWSVDESSTFTAPFVEVPFYFRSGDTVEQFAGPTLAFVDLDSVGSSGLNGLEVEVDPSTLPFGLHAGATLGLGWKQKWTIGVLARSIRTDIDLTVRQPFVEAIGESFSDEDDMVLVSLRVGRRFAP
jgi:hypothetical protein